MKYKDNINEVALLQPDYMGFIFYEKSSRYIKTDIPKLPGSIKKTGVFVNPSLEFVKEKILTHQLNAIQLHGEESPEYCLELNNDTIEIIKVFSIKEDFDFTILKPYEKVCDYYLFDTKGKLPGGNGFTFNWDVLKNYPSSKPFFLSGGIGLDEIEKLKAFRKTKASNQCYAIDVNSKFEVEPGLKNVEKIKTFKTELSFLI
ncbi:phosphoribosylanthranilate isomerase [Psychroserpens sp. MEBiC05023]